MKYLFIAAAALLVTTGSSMAQDWSGAYAGIHAGGLWGKVDVRNDYVGAPDPTSYHVNGGLGGATIGYNYQAGNILAGVEGSLGYLAPSGSGVIGSADAQYHQDLTLDGGLYGDLTGRVGFVVNQTLLYGKGGAAFFAGKAKQATTKPDYTSTGTDTFVGWTVGAGVEHMIVENVSVKAEYQHYGFGEQRGYQTSIIGDQWSPGGTEFDNYTKLGFDTVKVGINLHF
ncbi:MAG: outer membrane beta-barrel protein [Candidatus Kaistia colombiensis]|nr:MAG: outer membrane beta-barrel protein [Kaistia sp.]